MSDDEAAFVRKLEATTLALDADNKRLRKQVRQLRAELDRERERCGVLEAEVRASRLVTPTHDATAVRFINTGGTQHGGDRGDQIMQLLASRKETDTRHALDAAKFVGGG